MHKHTYDFVLFEFVERKERQQGYWEHRPPLFWGAKDL